MTLGLGLVEPLSMLFINPYVSINLFLKKKLAYHLLNIMC